MNCVSPPELDDRQLLAYLDDHEANQETALHLKDCPYCNKRTEALMRLQNRLATRLHRLTCPSPMELGEYYLRTMPDAQKLIIAQHLRECRHCEEEFAQLTIFLSDLSPDTDKSFPGQVKVIIARLIGGQADTSPQGIPSSTPAFTALRGEGKGPLIFEADDIVISLDVQPSSKRQVSILGQVAADDQDQWTGALVELQQVDAPPLTASLDDLGAFRLEAVRPGFIQIKITSPAGIEVKIPDIDITV
jgi:hypothetical protein